MEKKTNEDPYYLHLYKINFDGTGMKLLNPGEYEHGMSMDDNKEFFVDNLFKGEHCSQNLLYTMLTARKILDLETTDFLR